MKDDCTECVVWRTLAVIVAIWLAGWGIFYAASQLGRVDSLEHRVEALESKR